MSLSELLSSLPVWTHRQEILKHLETNRDLILQSPTGSGKSLALPWILREKKADCTIRILQPRRLAARSLAQFSRKLCPFAGNTILSDEIGWAFRNEKERDSQTRILFQTYGSFVQELLHQEGENTDWILFDEIHELSLEMEQVFLWWQHQTAENRPRAAFLSAAFNTENLKEKIQGNPFLIEVPSFPVSTERISPTPGEKTDSLLRRGLQHLLRAFENREMQGTTLCFLPGKSEIQRALNTAQEILPHNWQLASLHGSSSPEEQQKLLTKNPKRRIIFCTNIAETSITVPGVCFVLDSGTEKIQLRYLNGNFKNVLEQQYISLQNSIQRKGRAGRTRPGIYIPLWSEEQEAAFSSTIEPALNREDLSRFILETASLLKVSLNGSSVSFLENTIWLSHPPQKRLKHYKQQLLKLGLINHKGITLDGLHFLKSGLREASLFPLYHPSLSINLQRLGFCAAYLWENASEISQLNQNSLFETLSQLPPVFKNQLQRHLRRLALWNQQTDYRQFLKKATSELQDFKELCFSEMAQCIAVPSDDDSGNPHRNSWHFPDGGTFKWNPSEKNTIALFLPFPLLHRDKVHNRSQIFCPFPLPLSEEDIPQSLKQESVQVLWKKKKNGFTVYSVKSWQHPQWVYPVPISRQELSLKELENELLKDACDALEEGWWEYFKNQKTPPPWKEGKLEQLLRRMRLASQNFPEYGFPEWSEEDLELVLKDSWRNCFTLKEITPERIHKAIWSYFGEENQQWLNKNYPLQCFLKSGRKAVYHYPEDGLPIISARISDFLGEKGEHFIAEGRQQVQYNLLAPNWRTAQTTMNLTEFWTGSYLQIRKELRGRYPKHNWP
jgi:ATP-dependent helicase HrpB